MSLHMPNFPPRYVVPNFIKYKGKTNPLEHIWEFTTNCMDISYEHTYLMRLFPRSLASPTLEWFSTFPKGIKSLDALADKFVWNYTYNIDTNVSITNLCILTQEKMGETFIPFFQRWKSLASGFHVEIPKKEKVDMFFQNLLGPLK